MILTARQYSILKVINESSKSISSEVICQKLSISARTLRYEVSEINAKAKENIIRSNANGYFINVDVDLNNFFENIKFEDFFDEGGINWLAIKILDRDKVSLYELEELFHKSASSLNKSINNSNNEMERLHIKLTKKGEFIIAEGHESDKRKYLMHTFFKDGGGDANILLDINRYFEVLTPEDIHHLIDKLIDTHNIKIADLFLKNIVLVVSVTLQRIYQGYPIENKKAYNEINGKEKLFVDAIIKEINKITKIEFSKDEEIFLYRTLLPLIKTGVIEESDLINEDDKFQSNLLMCVNDTLDHFKIDNEFEDLLPSFTLHVYYLIARARSNAFFSQDITGFIKYSDPFVYEVAVYLSGKLEEKFNIKISNDEIGLLAIYFNSIVNKDKDGEKVKVVVVCPNYHALKNAVCEKIDLYFKTQISVIECTVNYDDIKSIDYDFIISVYEKQKTLKNVVCISPLFAQKDIEKIELRLAAVIRKKSINELEKCFRNYLKDDCFFYVDKKEDGNEVLEKLSDKLYKEGIVPKNYSNNLQSCG